MLKNVTLILIMLVSCVTISMGQLRTPAPSPAATVNQTVGLTEVTIEYSRPGKKGRALFGDLVPYGKMWRTGANSATKISFSHDVTIEGKELKAGSYALLTKPGMTTWEIFLYPYESGNFSSYLEKEAALTVSTASQDLPLSVESFTIAVGDLSNDGANIQIIWGSKYVPVKLGVHSDKMVMADIEKMLAGPSANDYYAMGQYMADSGKDLNKALNYVQKATKSESPMFWQVRQESLILAKLGRKAEAIKAAQLSLELAKTAGNDDYVRMNEKSIKEWSM